MRIAMKKKSFFIFLLVAVLVQCKPSKKSGDDSTQNSGQGESSNGSIETPQNSPDNSIDGRSTEAIFYGPKRDYEDFKKMEKSGPFNNLQYQHSENLPDVSAMTATGGNYLIISTKKSIERDFPGSTENFESLELTGFPRAKNFFKVPKKHKVQPDFNQVEAPVDLPQTPNASKALTPATETPNLSKTMLPPPQRISSITEEGHGGVVFNAPGGKLNLEELKKNFGPETITSFSYYDRKALEDMSFELEGVSKDNLKAYESFLNVSNEAPLTIKFKPAAINRLVDIRGKNTLYIGDSKFLKEEEFLKKEVNDQLFETYSSFSPALNRHWERILASQIKTTKQVGIPTTIYRGVRTRELADAELETLLNPEAMRLRVKGGGGTRFGAGLYAGPLELAKKYEKGNDGQILQFKIPEESKTIELETSDYYSLIINFRRDIMRDRRTRGLEKLKIEEWQGQELFRRFLRQQGVDSIKIKDGSLVSGESYFIIINPRIISNPSFRSPE